MEPRLADLLRELEEAYRERGGIPRIIREAGQFLNILVKATRATNILQVGVGDGYTLLWLAQATAATGGTVTGIEEDVWQLDIAREAIERSPDIERIHLQQGDLSELLPVLAGPFDFVLLDANLGQALHYFRLLFTQISSGSLICCDRAMSNAGELVEYLAYMHERPGLESILAPIGEGIEITYKVP